MHETHKSEYGGDYDDDDGVDTLDLNILLHFEYYYIIVTPSMRTSVVKHYYEEFDCPNVYFFTLFLFCNKIFNEKIRECNIFPSL